MSIYLIDRIILYCEKGGPRHGSPYVYVVLTDTRGSFIATRRQAGFPENHFGMTTTAIPITSLDDLKDLPKKISEAIEGAFRSGSSRDDKSSRDSTVFKTNATEFEELGIKIGDKITLEIKISNNNDIKA
jgi:hypothetical protein